MKSRLPLIVGFGGFNAAGRSSGHQAYKRMVLESLAQDEKAATLSGLAALMGLPSGPQRNDEAVLAGTLVRKIESTHFDADNTPLSKKYTLEYPTPQPATFTVAKRNLPTAVPPHWRVENLQDSEKYVRVTIDGEQEFRVEVKEPIAFQSAGQLPSGFDPASCYRSLHHPRGLQMAILGASDALHSMGLSWPELAGRFSPDEISVYSASIMSQLDENGFGGLFRGRMNGNRATSKQVALGMNTMPADFINAYVLGSMGATGGTAGACATFLYNLRQGVEDIRSGRCKISVIGASEAPILPEIIDGYGAMGALASDAELCKLDSVERADHRRASRPFGDNCGFVLAESAQYIILMADDLAMETGAKVYGAVPGVFVNADGFKRSISAPGAGNYITMAKALGFVKTLLGEDAVKHRSIVQAHGSSTPQNRTTESKIFDTVAAAFGIESWPVGAVKAYLGHSLAAASGDQLAATLGIFAHGILPGIKTHQQVAEDVNDERLAIPLKDMELGAGLTDVAFLNSKGFGGNNATAAVFSPQVVGRYLANNYSKSQRESYQKKLAVTEDTINAYINRADQGKLDPIYEFGSNIIDEEKIELSTKSIRIPGFAHSVSLEIDEGLSGF